ncbi:hypothetical protein IO90_09700 [Chryseobacterium sp. FH1]|nr:hypothetical protein IO90_09700 [Chryseobacterium sp. FH1]
MKSESILEKDNSELQSKLINFTKKFNAEARKDSNNVKRLEEMKLEYENKVDSIKICQNWKGKITLLDLDEVDAYSKDTVVMRIIITNNYGSNYQDSFSFVEVQPIPKNGKLYEKLSRIEENTDVVFSGKILAVDFKDITSGNEFSNFFVATEFSEIKPATY